jgi:uncharacterized membrane protein YdcZ (DUF606 family)
MPESVFGLPTHALLVHATVVLLPLAALAVLLHALWPAARRRLGIVTPLLAGVALVLVPLSTESGETLEHQVGENPLVERHAELADGMLPWAIGLFVVAVGLWILDRRRRRTEPQGARWVPLVAGVLAVVAVVGTVQQIVRVGHAGAEATWSDVIQGGPVGDDDD